MQEVDVDRGPQSRKDVASHLRARLERRGLPGSVRLRQAAPRIAERGPQGARLAHEVAYHKAVIDAVTNQFVPAIQNAELKAFVLKVAPAFDAHLKMAENLLKK